MLRALQEGIIACGGGERLGMGMLYWGSLGR